LKTKYRPEIDGLRAIAITAVIFYHAQITIFDYKLIKGGFIGVDIFFVISGYLITSIILKELISTGTFSFKNFYKRRIRRIFPTLLFVMFIFMPIAWICLLPSSFIDFSKSILYSLGFNSNYYFYYSGQQYGNENGLLKPFLHTWSLSIEEQYYLLFPIILFIIFKYLRKYLLIILILFFIISLLLSDWLSKNSSSLNFYFLPTRAWELLAGSILAYFEIRLGRRSKNKIYNSVMPTTGIILIGYSIIFFNQETYHPSFYTLPPIVGVCLIIWSSDKNTIVTKILSSKLFVGIGLISYSLYLWHYPILSFARITEFVETNNEKKIILGLIIISFSIISYFLIEKTARYKKIKFKLIFFLLVGLSLFLIILNYVIIYKKGFEDRFPEIVKKIYIHNSAILKNSKNEICFDNKEECVFNKTSNKKVYLIGDSHFEFISFYLKNKLLIQNYQFITSTIVGCIYFPGFSLVNEKSNKETNCNENYFYKLEKKLKENNNSIIIFGGRFPLYLEKSSFDNNEGGKDQNLWMQENKFIKKAHFKTINDSFKNSVEDLSKKNKIVLVYPLPEVGWNVPRKLINNYFYKKEKFSTEYYLTTSYKVYSDRTKTTFQLLDSIKGENIYRVFPHKLFCNNLVKDRCVTHDEKNIFYKDDNHPSAKGAEMINDLIMKEINKIK
jgi:peptidoglycan/LPS O-acetylase OafA/YrhL